MSRYMRDIIGEVSGRLTVLSQHDMRVICQCTCGGTHEMTRGNFISGLIKSCGCIGREKSARARLSGRLSSTFHIWEGMKSRCYSPTNRSYKNYGGRGIKVCDRWKSCYRNFLEDMGVRPEGLSIERIDNDGDYCPENCKWATQLEQVLNRRNTRVIEVRGKLYTMKELCEEFNMNPCTMHDRYHHLGLRGDDLIRPINKNLSHPKS